MWNKIGWLLKRFPHPSYGNYGGFYNRCKKQTRCLMPIDWMDQAFQEHDSHILTNKQLVKVLLLENPYQLANLPYGRFYRLGAIAIFSIAEVFNH